MTTLSAEGEVILQHICSDERIMVGDVYFLFMLKAVY